ncbi:hypothetical protein AAVH_42782, partial [Aphelenchoides avenae]
RLFGTLSGARTFERSPSRIDANAANLQETPRTTRRKRPMSAMLSHAILQRFQSTGNASTPGGNAWKKVGY